MVQPKGISAGTAGVVIVMYFSEKVRWMWLVKSQVWSWRPLMNKYHGNSQCNPQREHFKIQVRKRVCSSHFVEEIADPSFFIRWKQHIPSLHFFPWLIFSWRNLQSCDIASQEKMVDQIPLVMEQSFRLTSHNAGGHNFYGSTRLRLAGG